MQVQGRGGDRGLTSLLSGERVAKTDARVQACGDIDELSSAVGVLAAALPAAEASIRGQLEMIQSDLFTLGAWASAGADPDTQSRLRVLDPGRVGELEVSTEGWTAALPPLQSFILPGGHPTAAWAHLARTVCRRAERSLVALDPPPPGGVPYLNRLSGYFFALARWCNHLAGVPDTPWRG